MAALPYPGTTDNGMFESRSVVVLESIQHRSIRTTDGAQYWIGAGKDAVVGNPAPGYKFERYGSLKLRLAISSGTHIVYAQVLQPDASATRPFLRVLANGDIGFNAPLTSTAGSSTGWQTLAVSVTASQDGGVLVELCNADLSKPCWFDNVTVL
jgi:hypothetical protein